MATGRAESGEMGPHDVPMEEEMASDPVNTTRYATKADSMKKTMTRAG